MGVCGTRLILRSTIAAYKMGWCIFLKEKKGPLTVPHSAEYKYTDSDTHVLNPIKGNP